MFRFQKSYGLLTLLLLCIEILIAVCVHDAVIRPYIGDLLVVILVYCFVRCFTTLPLVPVALGSLLFACLVETLQYFRLVELLGLADSRMANILIGNSFAWMDILAYLAGTIIILLAESGFHRHQLKKNR